MFNPFALTSSVYRTSIKITVAATKINRILKVLQISCLFHYPESERSRKKCRDWVECCRWTILLQDYLNYMTEIGTGWIQWIGVFLVVSVVSSACACKIGIFFLLTNALLNFIEFCLSCIQIKEMSDFCSKAASLLFFFLSCVYNWYLY